MLPLRDITMIPMSWKLREPPGHFGHLMTLNQQAKKGVTMLAGEIDPGCQEEIGLSTMEVRKNMCGIQEIP